MSSCGRLLSKGDNLICFGVLHTPDSTKTYCVGLVQASKDVISVLSLLVGFCELSTATANLRHSVLPRALSPSRGFPMETDSRGGQRIGQPRTLFTTSEPEGKLHCWEGDIDYSCLLVGSL